MARHKRPRWPLPDAPGGSPEGVIQRFCVATWTGNAAPPEDVRWLADCLSEILADPNHSARSAFGMSAKGRPADVESHSDYLLYVGLARRYGHTLEAAIEQAASEFSKAESTIRRAVRGMRTHKPEFMGNLKVDVAPGRNTSLPNLTTFDTVAIPDPDLAAWGMEQILLHHGRKPPLCPRCLSKKPAKRARRTPGNK